jgi:hypothetical protein
MGRSQKVLLKVLVIAQGGRRGHLGLGHLYLLADGMHLQRWGDTQISGVDRWLSVTEWWWVSRRKCKYFKLLELSLRYWGVTERWHNSEVNTQGKIYFCRRVHTHTGSEVHSGFISKAMLPLPWIGQVWGWQSAWLAYWKGDIGGGFEGQRSLKAQESSNCFRLLAPEKGHLSRILSSWG